MTDIDISPDAIEHLCFIHAGYEQHGTVTTLRAMQAALQRSRAETAAAIERAAAWMDSEALTPEELAQGFGFTVDYPRVAAAKIRALTTPDQSAALAAVVADAEARVVEKIAAMVRTWRNTTPMTGEECANAILYAIPKGEMK